MRPPPRSCSPRRARLGAPRPARANGARPALRGGRLRRPGRRLAPPDPPSRPRHDPRDPARDRAHRALVYLWWGSRCPDGEAVRRGGAGATVAAQGSPAIGRRFRRRGTTSSESPRSWSWSWSRPRRLPFLFNDRNGVARRGRLHERPGGAAVLDRLAPARRRARAEGRAVRLSDRPAVGRRRRRRDDQHLAPGAPSTASCSRSRCSPRSRPWRRSGASPPARRAIAASLTGLPPGAPPSSPRAPSRRPRWRSWSSRSRSRWASWAGACPRARPASPTAGDGRRAVLFVVASVFVYSLPGLAWFALAVPLWLVLALATGGLRIDLEAVRRDGPPPPPGHRRGGRRGDRGRRFLRRSAIRLRRQGRAGAGLRGQAQLAGLPGRGAGRLAGGRLPRRPGRRLRRLSGAGARPARGRRSARSARSGAASGGWWRWGRAPWSVYVGARAFASIYVEAKALAIMSPLVVMAALLTLFSPSRRGGRGRRRGGQRRRSSGRGPPPASARPCSSSASWSRSPMPLRRSSRSAPPRSASINARTSSRALAGLTQDRTVAFLGVDRFAGYWLRGTLMRSPGGYVPADIQARPSKVWQQGLAMDFDTLSAGRLDEFRYVITTRAGYQSTAPPNFKPVVRTDSYVLWRRRRADPGRGHHRARRLARRDARLLDRRGPQGHLARTHSHSAASPGGHGHQGLEQAVAVRRAGNGQPEPRARPRTLEPLAPVPQPGPADGLRGGPPGRAAALARRHVPDCTRPRAPSGRPAAPRSGGRAR